MLAFIKHLCSQRISKTFGNPQTKTKNHQNLYSESQIYDYIARVSYNVVFSTYLGSNAAEIELRIKKMFLKKLSNK